MLTILGYAVILIMTVLVHRAAQKNNRPGLVWAICNVGVGLVIQVAASFLVLKLIVALVLAPGGSGLGVDAAEKLNTYANFAGIGGILISLVVMFVVMKLASRRG